MITIRVPATTANLGSGFDTLGLALQLYLNVTVRQRAGARGITYRGRGGESVPVDETNLIWRAFRHVTERRRVEPPDLMIDIENQIPLARGLGSSGAAVVAGVLAANEVCRLDLSPEEALAYALDIESHPDNIAAALVGGLVACCVTQEGRAVYGRIPISDRIKAVVVVPDFELPTVRARAVLPDRYARQDAVFNLQRVALLVAGLRDPRPDVIAEAMRDRLHQPYRQDLIPGLEESLCLTDIDGLLGVSLSGAGPSVLALAADHLAEIGERIQANFQRHGIRSEVFILDIDTTGAQVSGDWESGIEPGIT